MEEKINDNNSIKSTGKDERNDIKKNNLEINTGLNDSDIIKPNKELKKDYKSYLKTTDKKYQNQNQNTNPNYTHINNTHSEELPFFEPLLQYNSLNTDSPSDLQQDIQKQRVEKKTNKNLRLLKIIKERIKEQQLKKIINVENKDNKENNDVLLDDNLNNLNNNEELSEIKSINEDKEEEVENLNEKINDNDNKNDNEENNILNKDETGKDNKIENYKNLDEEKKNKLLNIISSKKYNKFQRKQDEKELEKEKDKENLEINQEEEEEKTSNVYKKDDKSSNKKTIRSAFSENNINNIASRSKSLSAKKDTFALLGLLKMKKKELDSKINNEDIEVKTDDNNSINKFSEKAYKRIESYNYRPKKRDFGNSKNYQNMEIDNSDSKQYIGDENEESSLDYKNRTQKQFHNFKTLNNNIHIQNYNNNDIIIKNYFKLNNKIIKPLANMSNHSYVEKAKIFPKINKINYNPISIKNKLRDKLYNFCKNNNLQNNNVPQLNTTNNNNYNYNSNILPQNFINIKNSRTIENSHDPTKNHPFSKKILNRSTLTKSINKSNKKANNQSPPQLINYERNTLGNDTITYNINNNNGGYINSTTKVRKSFVPYVKRSPDKTDENYNSEKNKFIYHNKTVYNKKQKNPLNNYQNRSIGIDYINNNNNYNNNIIIDSNDKLLSFETNAANDHPGLDMNVNMNLFKTARLDSNHNKNNYTKIDKIKNLKNSNIPSLSNNYNKFKTQYLNHNNSIVFNLEDLIILQERLNIIILALKSNENIPYKCFDYLNYYYNCSLYNLIEKIFKEESNTVRISINYLLVSVMICYKYSFDINVSKKELLYLLIELIEINHNNLINICDYILTKISPENKQNIWVIKLKQIIRSSKLKARISPDKNYINYTNSTNFIEKINFNMNLIHKKINNILKKYPYEYNDILISLLQDIETKTYEEINNFFKKFILRVNNFDGSIPASSFLKKNKYFKPLPAPYIQFPSEKPYTLILDLDETLVHFKVKSSKGGTLRARPYLFGFLEEVGHYYELIVWSSATEAYANSLIDAVEYEKKYFDHVLYREHCIIIDDDFVKDLTRVGRDLDKIIIIDDMPQNFRLQKGNGITIKPFYGDDFDDSALYNLVPILKHIAEERNDVRIGLNRYREEIVKKVTSNIEKKY